MAKAVVMIDDKGDRDSVNLHMPSETERVNSVDKELEAHLQCIRALIREINNHGYELFRLLRAKRGDKAYYDPDGATYAHARRSLEKSLYALAYSAEATEEAARTAYAVASGKGGRI